VDPSDDDLLILVDSTDAEIGFETKRACHDGDGALHRAFSVFLFNPAGQVLLQKRAAGKRLWAGYWSNSCCSHPRKGEVASAAAVRRTAEELGIEAVLNYLFKFEYQARFGEAGTEHELCYVYIGKTDEEPAPDPDEIDDWAWLDPAALDEAIAADPQLYTPWFKMEWQRLRKEHAADIAAL
jgi:isopentenyl-diphosphate delta-isomerase